jgi:hypothetical protein
MTDSGGLSWEAQEVFQKMKSFNRLPGAGIPLIQPNMRVGSANAQKLVEAARILAGVPQAMQLRYLGTLFDIASERGTTIVFPFPIELAQAFAAMAPRA